MPFGKVLVGGQFEGAETDNPPLIFVWDPNKERLTPVVASEQQKRALRHYCGSVAIDPTGSYGFATSPRGNVGQAITLSGDGRVIGTVKLLDVCGVASVEAGSFILTSGFGVALQAKVTDEGVRTQRLDIQNGAVQWDNHLASAL